MCRQWLRERPLPTTYLCLPVTHSMRSFLLASTSDECSANVRASRDMFRNLVTYPVDGLVPWTAVRDPPRSTNFLIDHPRLCKTCPSPPPYVPRLYSTGHARLRCFQVQRSCRLCTSIVMGNSPSRTEPLVIEGSGYRRVSLLQFPQTLRTKPYPEVLSLKPIVYASVGLFDCQFVYRSNVPHTHQYFNMVNHCHIVGHKPYYHW